MLCHSAIASIAFFVSFLLILCCCSAVTSQHKSGGDDDSGHDSSKYRPVVLYHGMGDNCCSEGMVYVTTEIQRALPGIHVHSVMIGDSPTSDTQMSMFDNINRQIDEVCAAMRKDEKLAGGFNAIGFSQGGLFLRAYVERCNDPPVHRLITLGSPHGGVSSFPGCLPDDSLQSITVVDDQRSSLHLPSSNVLLDLAMRRFGKALPQRTHGGASNCDWWNAVLKFGAYSQFVRENVVQAQFYKSQELIEEYHKYNVFLRDINNEDPELKTPAYKSNMKKLNALVMYKFEEDVQVVPRETAWFGYHDGTRLVPLQEQPMYQEDWIGLKALQERGSLFFLTLPGGHLSFSEDFVQTELVKWLAD